MWKRRALILLFVVSLVLFFFAPTGYSLNYTIYCTIIYVLTTALVLSQNCKKFLIKFEFFFLLALFFTNYVYSVVYYPVNPYFSLFNYDFNEDYISKGLGLSTVGLCSFCLGVFEKHEVVIEKKNFQDLSFNSPLSISTLLLIIIIPTLYALFLLNKYVTDFEHSFVNTILVYLVYFSIFYVIYNSRKIDSFRSFAISQTSSPFVYSLGAYVVLLLLIGSRTIPLRVILLFLFLYSVYIKQISSIMMGVLIIMGALLMSIVGVTRMGGSFEVSAFTSIFDIGKDLTINNRSLYVLIEQVDQNGITYGRTLLMYILSVVPFAQGVFLNVMGWRVSSISSASFVTDMYFDYSAEESIGLGTNIIGDCYLAFGLLGVILLMFFLGRTARNLYKKASMGDNLATLMYAILFMDAIYFPRASVLNSLRALAWVYVIYQIFKVSRNNYLKVKTAV